MGISNPNNLQNPHDKNLQLGEDFDICPECGENLDENMYCNYCENGFGEEYEIDDIAEAIMEQHEMEDEYWRNNI